MKIGYFKFPTGNGGVIFQNWYLEERLRGRLCDRGIRSISCPDLASNIYLQGDDRTRDLTFTTSSNNLYYYSSFETIDKINNGEIDV